MNTVNPEFFPEHILGCLRHRKDKALDKEEKVIYIAPEFKDLIFNTMTTGRSTKTFLIGIDSRGRAVHLLSAGAKRNKKRKRPDD